MLVEDGQSYRPGPAPSTCRGARSKLAPPFLTKYSQIVGDVTVKELFKTCKLRR